MGRALKTTADVLLIIAGLNWGLAIFNVNLVTAIFGQWAMLVKIVYGLVGAAAIWAIYEKFK